MSSSSEQLLERQLRLKLLSANYAILIGLVERWVAIESIGARPAYPECARIALDLATDAIPFLRARLGLAPDPNLAQLAEEILPLLRA